MSDFTQPLYAAPIVLDGTERISVTMGAGSTSSSFSVGTAGGDDAALTAGTYYNHLLSDSGGLSSFANHIAYTLSEADFAVNAGVGDPAVTPNWVATTAGSGLSFRLVFTRTGLASDTIDEVDAYAMGTTHFGWTGQSITPGTELVNSSDDTIITATYQRGYIWAPRELLTYDVQIPVGTRAVSVTNSGAAVVDGYGSYRKREQRIEYVHGALVYLDKAADAQSLGFYTNVTGLAQGDLNAPLETFWGILGGNNGAAPVVYYVPDSGTLTTSQAMVFADADWLEDMNNVAEIMGSGSPLLYRVTMRGQESV